LGGSAPGEALWLHAFLTAQRSSPSVILIEAADEIAATETLEETPAAPPVDFVRLDALLTLLRRLRPRCATRMVLIATASSSHSVNSVICAEMDLIIGLRAPSESQRAALIVSSAALHGISSPPPALLSRLARATPGFLPADLGALCEEVRMVVMLRSVDAVATTTARGGVSLHAEEQDWLMGAARVHHSGFLSAPPRASAKLSAGLASVRGHRRVKRQLDRLVLQPLRDAHAARRLGLGGSRGLLLYGPPGTGKTLIVRALAAESGLALITASIPQLVLPHVGESERAIAELFLRAKAHAPCLLLLDELQAIFGRRSHPDASGAGMGSAGRQMLSQLVLEMDALDVDGEPGTQLIVVGVTNSPDALDGALLRPGRLEHALYLPPPSAGARRAILADHLRQMPLGNDMPSPMAAARELASRTDGLTGADLASLCQKAALEALRRVGAADLGEQVANEALVTGADFEAALTQTTPSVSRAMQRRLEGWRGAADQRHSGDRLE
jgi:transitional endoplasmic reticulum ATPase